MAPSAQPHVRWEPPSGDRSRVAVIAPGRGYSPAHPLLEFSRQALLQHGWVVRQLWWEPPEDLTESTAGGWVEGQVAAAFDREPASRRLLVGKSLGSRAAPYAAGLGLDAVWFTPLLTRQEVREAVAANARSGARQLLVGGLADELWDRDVARELAALGCEVFEQPGATHGMDIPGDAVRSAQVQVAVSVALEGFLAAIG